MFGKHVRTFSSTHERSHLLSAYGMSPFPQGEPCYALVWEGNIGSFYEITPDVTVIRVAEVMEDPGNKYQYIFALADPTSTAMHGGFRFSNAGKLMALAGYADGSPITQPEQEVIDWVLSRRSILLTSPKSELAASPFYDVGVSRRRSPTSPRITPRRCSTPSTRWPGHADQGVPAVDRRWLRAELRLE